MIHSFLLIGQSNMAGRGRLEDTEPLYNEKVLMYRPDGFVTAKEPIHTDKPELAGVGLAMSFGDALEKQYRKTIGLIPCAMGGSSLEEWKKGGALYTNALKTTQAALEHSQLKGILWHQGEADASAPQTANSYKVRFLEMIRALMRDLGVVSIPVVVGEVGHFLQAREGSGQYWQVVNSQIQQIGQESEGFGFVTAAGLTDNGDHLHFNTPSLRTLGLRYAAAWEECSRKLGVGLE